MIKTTSNNVMETTRLDNNRTEIPLEIINLLNIKSGDLIDWMEI